MAATDDEKRKLTLQFRTKNSYGSSVPITDDWEGLSEEGTEDRVVDWLGQRALYKV